MKSAVLSRVAIVASAVALGVLHARAVAGDSEPVKTRGTTAAAPIGPPVPPDAAAIDEAVQQGIAFLLSAQEGTPKAQWPYEGVYRVGGEIPVGYRIGGTGIVGECLVRTPGYASDVARQEAVRSACAFICAGIHEPLMNPVYEAGYDVRGWGYCYGARFLLVLRAAKVVPAGMETETDAALRWYLDAIQKTEIPEVGGWNYARQPGIETPSPASPFMTPPVCKCCLKQRRRDCQWTGQWSPALLMLYSVAVLKMETLLTAPSVRHVNRRVPFPARSDAWSAVKACCCARVDQTSPVFVARWTRFLTTGGNWKFAARNQEHTLGHTALRRTTSSSVSTTPATRLNYSPPQNARNIAVNLNSCCLRCVTKMERGTTASFHALETLVLP
jgi:hypothetical protein